MSKVFIKLQRRTCRNLFLLIKLNVCNIIILYILVVTSMTKKFSRIWKIHLANQCYYCMNMYKYKEKMRKKKNHSYYHLIFIQICHHSISIYLSEVLRIYYLHNLERQWKNDDTILKYRVTNVKSLHSFILQRDLCVEKET